MRFVFQGLFLTLLFSLGPGSQADVPVRDTIIVSPRPERFSFCMDYSCKHVLQLGLAKDDWQRLAAPFRIPAQDPAGERRHIADYVRAMEVLLGERTGTSGDLGGTFPGTGRQGQLDCIDESTNTTTYLKLLEQAGLLHWHRVDDRAHRGFFLFGWPHTTAVLREQGSGSRFVVDSWFHANGMPPEILPLGKWKSGWKPAP